VTLLGTHTATLKTNSDDLKNTITAFFTLILLLVTLEKINI